MSGSSGSSANYDPVTVAVLQPEHLNACVAEAKAAIAAAATLEDLKAARLAHQADRSPIAQAKREIGALPPSARAEVGKLVGMAMGEIGQALKARQEELEDERDRRILIEEAIDVTVVPPVRTIGARHPISLLTERLQDVFISMGWDVYEGPEIETEWHNFDAMNTPPEHPARQMQDSVYIDSAGGGTMLRTHTSPVQMRALLERGAPLYMVAPGKVFRADDLDATHTPVFHQIEGLAVDKGLTMAHLFGTLDAMLKALFGPDTRTRLRPSFFPFTEPSAELDFSGGAGDKVFGERGWVEWGGCGMVHPNVLAAAGLDPEVYSGFAFGMGIERAVMLRHGIDDMHDLIEGDQRFSRLFGMEL